jgi:hypothetical protein
MDAATVTAADLATAVAATVTVGAAMVMDAVAMPTVDGLDTVAQDAPDTAAHGLDMAAEPTDLLVVGLAADLVVAMRVDSAAVAMQAVVAAMVAADTGNTAPKLKLKRDGLRLVPFLCVYLAEEWLLALDEAGEAVCDALCCRGMRLGACFLSHALQPGWVGEEIAQSFEEQIWILA